MSENKVVMLDGMELMEPDNHVVYQPSKSRLTTQKEIDRNSRPAMTRNWFNRINPDIVDLDAGWPTVSIQNAHIGDMDISSMYNRELAVFPIDQSGSMNPSIAEAPKFNMFFDVENNEEFIASLNKMVEDLKKFDHRKMFEASTKFMKFDSGIAEKYADKTIKIDPDLFKTYQDDFMVGYSGKTRKQEMDLGFFYAPYMPQDLRPKFEENIMIDYEASFDFDMYNNMWAQPTTITTGDEHLDLLLGGGLKPGTVTLFASKAGVGKSALAKKVAAGLSINGTKFLYLSTEESISSIVEKIQALNNHNVDTNYKIAQTSDWCTNGLINTIHDEAEDASNIRVVFIDGLDHFKDAGSHVLGTQLRRIAQELDVAIVATNQLRADSLDIAGPMMPCGDFGLTASVDVIVAMIRRDREVELSCIKNRNTGNLDHKVRFDPASNMIWEPLKQTIASFENVYQIETLSDADFAPLKHFADRMNKDFEKREIAKLPVATWL